MCPGLKVVAPWSAADAKGLLRSAIRDPNPVIVLENEILYGQHFECPTDEEFIVPIGRAKVERAGEHVTIVAFSIMVGVAMKAAEALAEQGISAEVINLRSLRPLDTATIVESVKKTNRSSRSRKAGRSPASARRSRCRWSNTASTGSTRRRCGCMAWTCRCPTPPIWKSSRCRSPDGWWTRCARSSEGAASMATNILMPALSPTMTEGTLARWLKKEGETIKAGDVIAEIETDKATMEVEAVDEGVLGKILVDDGTEGVKVNAPIAILVDEGEAVPSAPGAERATARERESRNPVAGAGTVRGTRTGASPGARARTALLRQRSRGGRGTYFCFSARAPDGQAGRDRPRCAEGQRPERADREGGHRGGAQGRAHCTGRARRAGARRPSGASRGTDHRAAPASPEQLDAQGDRPPAGRGQADDPAFLRLDRHRTGCAAEAARAISTPSPRKTGRARSGCR